MRAASGPRGFTVIELMIAAVVTLLAASAGLPTLADMRLRHHVAAAGETLAADVQKARWAAIERGKPVYIAFDASPHGKTAWCYAVATRPDCPCDGSGANCAIKTESQAAATGVSLVLQRRSIAFEPRLGSTAAGTIGLFSAGSYVARVATEAVGRADLCSLGAAMAGYSAC